MSEKKEMKRTPIEAKPGTAPWFDEVEKRLATPTEKYPFDPRLCCPFPNCGGEIVYGRYAPDLICQKCGTVFTMRTVMRAATTTTFMELGGEFDPDAPIRKLRNDVDYEMMRLLLLEYLRSTGRSGGTLRFKWATTVDGIGFRMLWSPDEVSLVVSSDLEAWLQRAEVLLEVRCLYLSEVKERLFEPLIAAIRREVEKERL